MTLAHVNLVYLGSSGLEIAPPSDDLRGLVVVGPDGLRVGEVDDVVVDADARRARMMSVASGGILGFATHRALIPVEIVTKVDDRVHLDRSYADVPVCAASAEVAQAGDVHLLPSTEAEAAYDAFGVVPFWEVDATAGG